MTGMVGECSEGIFTFRGAEQGPFAGNVWRFRKGEQWVVMGPNGSGKSLLASLLAEDLPLRGASLDLATSVEEHVALMSFSQQQDHAADSWLQARWHDLEDEALSVRTHLSYDRIFEINPFECREDDTRERRAFDKWFTTVVKLLRLRPFLDHSVSSLSNGESRRFLLACALLKKPLLLVLDDPFAGLDPAMRKLFLEILDALAARGISLVMMVRNTDEIPNCATHLLRLDGLRMVSSRKITRKGNGSGGSCSPQKQVTACWRVREKKSRLSSPAVVECRNLTLSCGRRTLFRNFSWTVRQGERWLVVGPNGVGKTTLMSLITGDNPQAYASDIAVFGQPRSAGMNLWKIRARIGQISPEIQCYADLTPPALDAIYDGLCDAEGKSLRRTRKNRQRAAELLETMGVAEEVWQTPLFDLSMGTQRLVLIARSLFLHPELLILDEVCLNLEGSVRRHVLSVLGKMLKREKNLTVICIAHRPENVPAGMDHLLDLGIAAEGKVEHGEA